MKQTILALAVVAVVASVIGVVPVLQSSFAATDTTAKADTAQTGQVQDNKNNEANDQETNDDGNDKIDPQLASQAQITADQASSIAVNHMSAQPGDVKSVSLDDENGRLVYSVELTKGGQSFDVKVDAISGQVANVDQGGDGESNDTNDGETNDDNSGVDDHSDGETNDDSGPDGENESE